MRAKLIKPISLTLIVLLAICALAHIYIFFSTHSQLTSPLVSQELVSQLANPFLYAALLYAAVTIFSIILFWNQKYLLAIIFSSLGLLMQSIHPHQIFVPMV